ncbi:MAG: insulinase family protein, partial [Erysipelotrichaceae bacterium]|nr:insulinase family protein [Erysipelotrichaceae bacterium]
MDFTCCPAFEFVNEREVEELHAKAVQLKHKKTGAEVLWMNNGEMNKTFSIAFKTLPDDDTGVFHILEHSVLNGSKKYPVKEPFVELLKGSMQTFLNAMTFPDKTVYPVSSKNNKDFLNLMDVYMDAVFHTNIDTKKETFLQEGWHHELADAESDLLINGVVYNEMKGAYSSVDTPLRRTINKLLFPDTVYRY